MHLGIKILTAHVIDRASSIVATYGANSDTKFGPAPLELEQWVGTWFQHQPQDFMISCRPKLAA